MYEPQDGGHLQPIEPLQRVPAARPNLILPQQPKTIPTFASEPGDHGASQRFAVTQNGRIRIVDASTIDWIEACGNYVMLHCGSAKHLIRETMNAVQARLESSQFLRIHRSKIINARSISEVQPGTNGSFEILLTDQTRHTSSRGYHADVKRLLSTMR